MSKKKFAAPFWFMLILGFIASCMSGYAWYLYSLEPLSLKYSMLPQVQIRLFLMPAIIFVEVIMYWMIRKRNIYRRASWSHVLLFAFAFLTPFLKSLLFVFYDNFTPTSDMNSYIRFVSLGQICIFWGVMVLAHIFFVRLFVKAFSKQAVIQQDAAESENMLDDVLS